MSKSRKPVAEPRGKSPRGSWAIIGGNVRSVRTSVRACDGELCEVVVPRDLVVRTVVIETGTEAAQALASAGIDPAKGLDVRRTFEVPEGAEAAHIVAMAALAYVHALDVVRAHIPEKAHAVVERWRDVRLLLFALQNLHGASTKIDLAEFAALPVPMVNVGSFPVPHPSMHHAVIASLGQAASWILWTLAPLCYREGHDTVDDFLRNVHALPDEAAGDALALLRRDFARVENKLLPAGLIAVEATLRKEMAMARANIAQRRLPPPGGEDRRKDIARACINGDAKGLQKWPDVRRACGITDKDTTNGVDQDFREKGKAMLDAGLLERRARGICTTTKGRAHFGL